MNGIQEVRGSIPLISTRIGLLFNKDSNPIMLCRLGEKCKSMGIAFVVLFIISNELTYMVAVNQKMGLVRHISAGNLCWMNRIVLIVPAIWYCGWIVGIILFLFSLFGLLHATIGWILSIPSLFSKSEKTIYSIVELECGLLIPINVICLVFTVLSFFFAKYKDVYYLFNSLQSVCVLAAVLIVGLIARLIVSRSIKTE